MIEKASCGWGWLVFQGNGNFPAVGRERISISELLDVVGNESNRTVGETELNTVAVQGASRIEPTSMEADVGNRMVGGQISVDGCCMRDTADPAFTSIASVGIDDSGEHGDQVWIGDNTTTE